MLQLSFIIFILAAVASVFSGAAPDCTSPLDSGPCLALFHVYGYDPDCGECKEFIYGGCHGNRNRYDTLEECQAACKSGCKK
ncbi:trypsin inhibitor-like [Ostrinia furnacalis]|uniref:trypsin inhibitor-like n=1 Tax=Ostrinia furnacalis TaxID=93504 RepID=UPI00103CCDB7|nr:trypsin inhibitor-like [Ostrinia furnacalis]